MQLRRLLAAVRNASVDGVGVDRWSIRAVARRQIALGAKDRETGNVHAPLSLVHTLRAGYLLVWSDGRVSRGTLTQRDIVVDPQRALRQARAAAYEDPDAAQVRGPAVMPAVELHEQQTASLAEGSTAWIEIWLDDVRRRFRESGFTTWSGSCSASVARERLVTSAGLDVSGHGTATGWYVSFDGEWGGGHGGRSLDRREDYRRRLDGLASFVQLLKQPADSPAAGILPLLLHPDVVESFVLSTLLRNLDGAVVAHGTGHFQREQFGSGETVMRDDLALRLDPLLPLRSGAYRFSGEGVPAAPWTFIEQGRLCSPVADLKYARRLGIEPTAVPYAMDALQFHGEQALDLGQAYATAAGGALVLSVLGVHTQDPFSGDFSLSAPQGLRLGAAGPAGRLRSTISGNLFEILKHPELRFVRFPGEHTPGLLFPCRLDPS